MAELEEVLSRRKFDAYFDAVARENFLQNLRAIAFIVAASASIRACRDPRDDKFLEVAVHGHADLIVTGDADLLALNPFRGIAILTPAEYLERE